jgi:hypothetical protein
VIRTARSLSVRSSRCIMPNMARKRSDGKARPPARPCREQTLAEIEDFIGGFNQPTSAPCGSMGFVSLRGHPTTGGPGTAGPMRGGSNEPLQKCCKVPRFPACCRRSGRGFTTGSGDAACTGQLSSPQQPLV